MRWPIKIKSCGFRICYQVILTLRIYVIHYVITVVHPWLILIRLEKYFLRGIFVGKKRYFGEILGYFCKKSAILRRNNYDNLWLISVLVNFYGLYIFLFSNPRRKKSKIWKTINFRRKLQFLPTSISSTVRNNGRAFLNSPVFWHRDGNPGIVSLSVLKIIRFW